MALLSRKPPSKPKILPDTVPKLPSLTARRASILGFIVLMMYSLACAGTIADERSRPLTESEIKAGFIFNFTKFVEWPTETFADPTTPIVLGIVGDNPITGLLDETAQGKTIDGRSVIVRRLKTGTDPRNCQILFISASEEKQVPQILEKVAGSRVLTVSEVSGFAQAGGIINFVVEGNKVRLEINLKAAARAQVKISAKVIAVARLVSSETSGGRN